MRNKPLTRKINWKTVGTDRKKVQTKKQMEKVTLMLTRDDSKRKKNI